MTDTTRILINLKSNIGAKLHWGINPSSEGWKTPAEEYFPEGTEPVIGSSPAVETPFSAPDSLGNRQIYLGPFNGSQTVTSVIFVIHFDDDTWDNNNENNYKIDISPTEQNTSVERESVPENTTISSYPNPFNPTTMIRLSIAEALEADVTIFDLYGRKVASLAVRQHFSAGNHELLFDASSLSSGTYLVQMLSKNANVVHKIMLLK